MLLLPSLTPTDKLGAIVDHKDCTDSEPGDRYGCRRQAFAQDGEGQESEHHVYLALLGMG